MTRARAVLVLVLLLIAAGLFVRGRSLAREQLLLASESHTFGDESELRRWATLTREGEVTLESIGTGARVSARGPASVRIEGKPRRSGFAPSISLRFAGGAAPFSIELGVHVVGFGRSQWTLTRLLVHGEEVRCVSETTTEEQGERRSSTREVPCAFEPGERHELALRMYVQHRVALAALDGAMLPPESVVWFEQTQITPVVTVRWDEPAAAGQYVELDAFSMASPNNEYLTHGFDDRFTDTPMRSGRWFYVESDPTLAETHTLLGGKQGVVIDATPRNMPKGVTAGILTSRQFELGAVEVGGDIVIDELHESGTVVRITADSYWQPRRFDVGVFHAGERTVGYCSGNWNETENFFSVPRVYDVGSDRDLGTVRFKIAFDPRSRTATGFINDKQACQQQVDLPPYVGAMLQIGTNLHGPDSKARTRFINGWLHL